MKKTALALTLIFALLISLMVGFTDIVNANFFNTKNWYPTPVSPAIIINSPKNDSIVQKSNVSISFTLELPAVTHDKYGLWVYSNIRWVGYSFDSGDNITLQNKTIKYADDSQMIEYSIELTSLVEGPHNLMVIAAYDSFYIAVANSTSPLAFTNSSIQFVVNNHNPQVYGVSLKNETNPTNSVKLDFIVSEPTNWIGYSLDNKVNVTIMGNTTLTDLTQGSHSLIIYVNDTAGTFGASETINFSVEVPFPLMLVAAASVASVAVIGVGLLVYFMKRKR